MIVCSITFIWQYIMLFRKRHNFSRDTVPFWARFLNLWLVVVHVWYINPIYIIFNHQSKYSQHSRTQHIVSLKLYLFASHFRYRISFTGESAMAYRTESTNLLPLRFCTYCSCVWGENLLFSLPLQRIILEHWEDMRSWLMDCVSVRYRTIPVV